MSYIPLGSFCMANAAEGMDRASPHPRAALPAPPHGATRFASMHPSGASSGPASYLGRDPLGSGQERVLERRAVRNRRVRGRDPPRVVEVAERVLGDEREHLACPAAGERPLLDDGDPVRLLDGPTIVSASSGLIVRRSITSAETPCSRERSAAARQSCTPFIALTSVTSLPSRTTAARPSS